MQWNGRHKSCIVRKMLETLIYQVFSMGGTPTSKQPRLWFEAKLLWVARNYLNTRVRRDNRGIINNHMIVRPKITSFSEKISRNEKFWHIKDLNGPVQHFEACFNNHLLEAVISELFFVVWQNDWLTTTMYPHIHVILRYILK